MLRLNDTDEAITAGYVYDIKNDAARLVRYWDDGASDNSLGEALDLLKQSIRRLERRLGGSDE